MSKLNLETVRKRLENIHDVNYREYKCGSQFFTLVYIESITNIELMSEFIIKPLLTYDKNICNVEEVINDIILLSSATTINKLNDAITQVLSGNILIFFSSFSEVITCEVKGFSFRSVEKSETETVIKGPREGFVESLQVNISSIRRRIKTPDLKVEIFSLGKDSKTDVAMLYLEGESPVELVSYIKEKIKEVSKQDFVFYTNTLEEKLKSKWSPFDTIGYTEKPDISASKLAEGKVVVMLDGTPFAISAPYFFIENFMATDDYTMNIFMGNIGRALRFAAFLLSTLLPGFYLALVTHHFRLIPSIFLFKMAILRAGVPVPTVIEMLFMLFLFQIIREAAVRLPQPLGSTLSIVGALILGDAAVRSGLASQMTVVVVGITSISSYLIPKVYIAVFTWNIILIFFSASLGLPGFYTGFVLFVAHIANLDSCGYPYLYPMGTRKSFKFKDYTYRGYLSEITNNMLKEDKQ
ncbi:spore germination protein [Tissierella sp. Yu-01]|uniref:spore germination protein n=1 Tax=Tissierella sp. Yu-01 TaxID=3035694 RepID=UPI00240E2A18|nr:spore germination protein [Tissierella sp. Yu-01]WFA09340.1 spore germination protein [Tissierella sp. Yu-01]